MRNWDLITRERPLGRSIKASVQRLAREFWPETTMTPPPLLAMLLFGAWAGGIVVGISVVGTSVVRGEEIQQTKSNGPVTVTTTLEPSDPTIGDEVSLRIEARAEPDVELLMPEFDEVISGFPIAEWIPKQEISPDGSTVQSVQYKFQVSLSGEKSIPPILIEFVDRRPGHDPTPKDMDAYEILTDRIDFQVKSVLPKDAAQDLEPPLPELELPSTADRVENWWWIAGVPILICGVVAAVFWMRRRKTIRKANAFEIAESRLQRLLAQWQDPTVDLPVEQFFVEISSVIRRYLEDRFELRAPELTTDEFLQLASQGRVLSQEQQSMLSEFLSQADVVKFAGVQATEEDVQRSTQLAQKFLDETREDAPEIELPLSDSSSQPGVPHSDLSDDTRWRPTAMDVSHAKTGSNGRGDISQGNHVQSDGIRERKESDHV